MSVHQVYVSLWPFWRWFYLVFVVILHLILSLICPFVSLYYCFPLFVVILCLPVVIICLCSSFACLWLFFFFLWLIRKSLLLTKLSDLKRNVSHFKQKLWTRNPLTLWFPGLCPDGPFSNPSMMMSMSSICQPLVCMSCWVKCQEGGELYGEVCHCTYNRQSPISLPHAHMRVFESTVQNGHNADVLWTLTDKMEESIWLPHPSPQGNCSPWYSKFIQFMLWNDT